MSWERLDDIPGTMMSIPPEPLFDTRGEERFADGTVVSFDRFRMGDLSIFRSLEPIGPDGDLAWHLSLAPDPPERLVTWDEIKLARYRLLPDNVMMVIGLPPRQYYLDEPAQHVMHLHEVRTLAAMPT